MRAVAEHHRVEDVIEFGSLGDGGGDRAVEKQVDPGDADVVGCGNRNVESAALRIHRASGADDVTAVSGDQLHRRSLKVGNRIVQRVSSGNRIGVARLVGGGHGDEQRPVGVKSRTDCGQKILDRDIGGFVNLNRLGHAGSLGGDHDFVEIDVIGGAAESKGFVVRDGRRRIGRRDCHDGLGAVHLERSGNRIGVDSVGAGGDPVSVSAVRNILIEVDADVPCGVFLRDDRLILRVQDLEFPGGSAGDVRRKREAVFDSVAVRADELVAGDDVENRRLIVDFGDRTGNRDDCGDGRDRVQRGAFGVPGVQRGDRGQIGKSRLRGRVDGNLQPVRHGFRNGGVGLRRTVQQKIGRFERDVLHFPAARIEVKFAGAGGRVAFDVCVIVRSVQRNCAFRNGHFHVRVDGIADVADHRGRKVEQRNDFIGVRGGDRIDFFVEIVRLLDDSGGRGRFSRKRLRQNVVLQRGSGQRGREGELFFPGEFFLADRHGNVVIVNHAELDAVDGGRERQSELIGDLQVPRNPQHRRHAGDRDSEIARGDLIEAVKLMPVTRSESAQRFSERRVAAGG